LKNPSESFDKAQDERMVFEIAKDFPVMLSLPVLSYAEGSKHSDLFSTAC
jgi:hypothetical protein